MGTTPNVGSPPDGATLFDRGDGISADLRVIGTGGHDGHVDVRAVDPYQDVQPGRLSFSMSPSRARDVAAAITAAADKAEREMARWRERFG